MQLHISTREVSKSPKLTQCSFKLHLLARMYQRSLLLIPILHLRASKSTDISVYSIYSLYCVTLNTCCVIRNVMIMRMTQ